MKSSYELAMERLEKQAPTHKVSDAQKAEIAEIDATFKAKIAEREVFLSSQLTKARAAGNATEAQELQEELSRELRRFQQDCEAKKESVRQREA